MKNKLNLLLLSVVVLMFYTSCKDKDAPYIALEGGTTVAHELNKAWEDPGFAAYDTEDGDLTASVTASALNVDSTGIHTIIYTVSDAAGNTATTNRRVIIYNAAKNFAGYWTGSYIYPYPGLEKKQYVDTIAVSGTKNYMLTITNFAGMTGFSVVGSVYLAGVSNAPLVRFASQTINGKTFTARDAKIYDNVQFTVEFTIDGQDGILVLNKQ